MTDLDRLDRAIAALEAARDAASKGLLFAHIDGAVAVEAVERLFQTGDLKSLELDIWSAANCSFTTSEVTDRLAAGAAGRKEAA